MSLRTFSFTGFTPTGTADATNLADGTHMTIKGGSGTQRARVEEIYMGGQAGASSVNAMLLSCNSQIGTGSLTYTAGAMDAILDQSAGALSTAVVSYTAAATNKPQRSNALHLLSLSFNSFGGIVRWVTSPVEYGPTLVGNTASLGEMSLSAFNIGTAGAMSAHIVYEPY